MKVYISIPITGHNLATQQAKAAEIAEQIRALGHVPVNPFDTPEPSEELSEKERYAYFMGEDIKRLLTCDAIFLCEDWSESRGCRVEWETAYVNNIADYYSIADIPKLTNNE